jgi:hypothetical protein
VIDAALGRGEVSYSQARAMVRVATPENQATLLEWAKHATAAQLEKICSKYNGVRRAACKERGDPPGRYMNRRTLDDGMVRIECVMRPEEAELVWQTVTRAARDVSAETFDHVDGLVALAQAAARGESLRSPVEVMVTVPMAALVEGDASGVGDRDHVSAETARRLTCDAGVVDVIESETGEILSAGSAGRFRRRSSGRYAIGTATAASRAATTASSSTAITSSTGPRAERRSLATSLACAVITIATSTNRAIASSSTPNRTRSSTSHPAAAWMTARRDRRGPGSASTRSAWQTPISGSPRRPTSVTGTEPGRTTACVSTASCGWTTLTRAHLTTAAENSRGDL